MLLLLLLRIEEELLISSPLGELLGRRLLLLGVRRELPLLGLEVAIHPGVREAWLLLLLLR